MIWADEVKVLLWNDLRLAGHAKSEANQKLDHTQPNVWLLSHLFNTIAFILFQELHERVFQVTFMQKKTKL